MKKIIHVNQHHIKHNSKTGDNKPVLSCKTYKSNDYGHEMILRDEGGSVVGKFVYSPDKPLPCGARVWFETTRLDIEVR